MLYQESFILNVFFPNSLLISLYPRVLISNGIDNDLGFRRPVHRS